MISSFERAAACCYVKARSALVQLAWAMPLAAQLGCGAGEAEADLGSAAQALVTDGFDYPIAPREQYYNAQDFETDCHLGEDWNAVTGGESDCGHAVYAVANGSVVYAGDAGSGWGRVVIVRHTLPDSSEVESLYAHLDSMHVSVDDAVTRGQLIGTIGDGGGACGDGYPYHAHLHLELRTVTGLGAGPGYDCSTPDGWTDPSTFIDEHRPGSPSSDGSAVPIAVGSIVSEWLSVGEERRYSFPMTSGQEYTVQLTPLSGDPDLYTHNAPSISTSDWLCRPFLGGLDVETCTFTAPWDGTNYVLVHGYTAASYDLQVTTTTCAGCGSYTGYLDGDGESDWHPNNEPYYADAGTHRGVLVGPADTDFDLELYRLDGEAWSRVASSTSVFSSEEVVYTGDSGYYLWSVLSFSGSGSYELGLSRP
ncbi:peptidoglycan DD-metalloendopeptidase family protein [Sorangium sp. So ce1389]|uniref:peptidoglycan DD-metalloendopeptidase family protein n=1 Tax=Sorangium sp. So ce1389 TaxID=3133336 RepID=UPI003F620362